MWRARHCLGWLTSVFLQLLVPHVSERLFALHWCVDSIACVWLCGLAPVVRLLAPWASPHSRWLGLDLEMIGSVEIESCSRVSRAMRLTESTAASSPARPQMTGVTL